MKATAKDLRFHSRELLDTVRRGEEVIITYRGHPCAKLVPFEEDGASVEGSADELFGIWRDHDQVEEVEEYVRRLRKGRVCR